MFRLVPEEQEQPVKDLPEALVEPTQLRVAAVVVLELLDKVVLRLDLQIITEVLGV
jgi:hypothetical protein